MKKADLFKTFLLLTCAISILSFSSCELLTNSKTEPRYKVWTDTSSYADFQTNFKMTLENGMYLRVEFTPTQWNTISATLTNDGKYWWTKNQIKDWFLGRNFDEPTATKSSSWLTTIDHGFIASRTGTIVYYILK